MPSRNGIPINNGAAAPFYIGALHPVDWIDSGGNEAAGISPRAAMQGHPPAFSAYQRRQIVGPSTMPQPIPAWLQAPTWDRGAQGFAPKFGELNINPIGAGIYSPYKLPPIAGPGARYQYGAIWFDVQSIPTTMRMNPTVPIETVNALMATSYVGASYLTTG